MTPRSAHARTRVRTARGELDGEALTDSAIVDGPRRSVRGWFRQASDVLAGADPGLQQLRAATQALLGVVVTVALVYPFVHLTGALQLAAGAAPAPVVDATNHALLIVAMLIGGILGMLAGFVVNDPEPRQQVISTLILPFPMLASICVGLLLGPYRLPSLIFLVVVMTVAVYVRRWGPRGFAAGLVAFQGGFLGFFLHGKLHVRDLGWVAAILGVGVVASLFVRFVVLRTDAEHTLDRMRRSWRARAARLLDLAADAVGDPSARHRASAGADPLSVDPGTERIRRQVVRLNEATLVVDAQLVLTTPGSAQIEAHGLFGAELSLTNCARFSAALAHVLTQADEPLRVDVRTALLAARDEDWNRASRLAEGLRKRTASSDRATTLVHRLAQSIDHYAESRSQLHEAIEARRRGDSVATFEPAVRFMNGYLPGSAPVSTAASTTPGRGRFEQITMPPYLRSAIQIAVASTLAVVFGDLLSGARLYWAVLAAFLAFMATTNTAEQVRKALFRVAGTAIGIVTGDLLVRATGGNIWIALPVVLVVLFLGIYLIRVNYTFMVIGITMMLSLIYYQLGEFSWHLLVLRLEETAIGVAAVVATVLIVLPLRPQRVLAAGVLLWFRALSSLIDASLDRLLGGGSGSLQSDVRALDAAWAALEATAMPLRSATFGRNSTQLGQIRSVSSAARYYARSFAFAVDDLDAAHLPDLRAAARDLRASTAAIDARIETGAPGAYMRFSSLVDHAIRKDPPPEGSPIRSALRDLTMLDGALARLATALDMEVRDHDTTDLIGAADQPASA